jgi:large subunit ribosomal protein L25
MVDPEKNLYLEAEERNVFGKKLAQIRKQGKMPAIVYGPKEKPSPVFVPLGDFIKIWQKAGESSLITLRVGGKKRNALIYDVDIDPVKNKPRHADFYLVDMAKKITAVVPLTFVGVAPSVKEHGAILVKVLHELEVEALPKDLPHEIKVDLSSLKTLEDKITVADLNVPAGVKITVNPAEVVVLAELPVEEAAQEAPSIEEIEVIGERKAKEKEEAAVGGSEDAKEKGKGGQKNKEEKNV